MRTVTVLVAVLLALGAPAGAQEPSLEVLAGAHFGLAPNLFEDLGYGSAYDDAEKTRYLLWPTLAIEVTDMDLGGLTAGGGLGIQPLFITSVVRSQLNPNDTVYDELDMSLYGTFYAELPLDPLSIMAGPVLRFHYWNYEYFYDSSITADTETYYEGTYVSFGALAGVSFDAELSESVTIPVSVRVYPSFASTFIIPVTVLAGISL